MFVDQEVYCKRNEPNKIESYRWLLRIFAGNSEFVVVDWVYAVVLIALVRLSKKR